MVAQVTPSLPDSSSTRTRLAAERAARHAISRREALLDAALVDRFKNGDQSAFAEIVSRYREKMLYVALRLLKNHADAEEIAQDTFIRAHRSLAFFRGESSLAVWLHCITLNLSRNRYWYFYRRRRHTTQSLDCAINTDTSATYSDLIACENPGPVQETATNEFSKLVAHCMTKLKPDQREILMLRNIREHSYEQIAKSLGIKIGTVKSRIGRARQELRLLLIKTYPEFNADDSPFEWFDPAFSVNRQALNCA